MHLHSIITFLFPNFHTKMHVKNFTNVYKAILTNIKKKYKNFIITLTHCFARNVSIQSEFGQFSLTWLPIVLYTYT